MIETVKMKKIERFNPKEVNEIISNQLMIYLSYFSGDTSKIPDYRKQEIKQVRDLLKRFEPGKDQIKSYSAFYTAYNTIVDNLQLKFFLFEYINPSRLKACLVLARTAISMKLNIKIRQNYPECFDDECTTIFAIKKMKSAFESKCGALESTISQQDAVLSAIRSVYGDDAINAIQEAVIREINLNNTKSQDAAMDGYVKPNEVSSEEEISDNTEDKTEEKSLSPRP